MRNRNLFPTNFLIKKEADKQELFVKYIEWLNTSPRTENWSGSCDYYGMHGEDQQCYDEYEVEGVMSRLECYVVTLEAWKEIMDNNHYVQTYDGNYNLESDCVRLSHYSKFPSQWALLNQTVSTNFGYHTALRDEVLYIDGESFLRNRANYHNIYFSNHHDEWLCSDYDCVHYGYVARGREDWFCSDEYVTAGGERYLNSEVAESCGWRYNEGRDEWVDEDEYDEDKPDKNNASYHNLDRRDRRPNECKFSIGFEIEKEDNEACEISYNKLYNDTDWIKENDSSLDEDNGYELVSPIYDLYSSRIDEDIKGNEDLQTLINGQYSANCGGHINISSTIYNPEQLFEGIIGFMPLLYGLYEHRLNKNYSEAKKKHEYYAKSKYSAIYIKNNVVELRLPPAVKNVSNLLWRRDLVRIMCENINKSESDVLRLLLNQNSKLYKHLRKIFPQDKLVDKIEKFIRYSNTYNNKKLPPVNISKIKKDNITGSTDEMGA
jgi:hypothetical protein